MRTWTAHFASNSGWGSASGDCNTVRGGRRVAGKASLTFIGAFVLY